MEPRHGRQRSNISGGGRPRVFRQKFVTRVSRGTLILQAWPKKRGPEQTPAARYWVHWLQENMRLWNIGPSPMRLWHQLGTRNLPAKAPDIFLQMQRGKWGFFEFDTGKQWIPKAALDYMTYSLDLIVNKIGSLIVRGPEDWQGIEPGVTGAVLTSNGPDQVPTWWSPPYQGWNFVAPDLADFSEANIGAVQYAQAPNGIALQSAIDVTGSGLRCLIDPIDYTNNRLTAAFNIFTATDSQFPAAGIILYSATTGKAQILGLQQQPQASPGSRDFQLNVANWNSLTSYNGNAFTWNRGTTPSPFWARITHNALYRTYEWSMDGTIWSLLYRTTPTSWLTPTHVGIFVEPVTNHAIAGLMLLSWLNEEVS